MYQYTFTLDLNLRSVYYGLYVKLEGGNSETFNIVEDFVERMRCTRMRCTLALRSKQLLEGFVIILVQTTAIPANANDIAMMAHSTQR